MVRTKHVIARQLTEGIPLETLSSSSGKEMEAPPKVENSEESSAEETVEEEALCRRGKAPEGRVNSKTLFVIN